METGDCGLGEDKYKIREHCQKFIHVVVLLIL